MEYKRGEIYFADLGTDNIGSEQSGTRPVLIIQNDIGNRFAPTVIVACITSKIYKNQIPTHVLLNQETYRLQSASLILTEQLKTIDKNRLLSKIGTLTYPDMARVNNALRLSLNI